MDKEASGSTHLFAVFIVSILSLFLIPYTLHVLLSNDGDEGKTVETWNLKKGRKKDFLGKSKDKLKRVLSWKLVAGWIVYLTLVWYVRHSAQPVERFDPFEILNVAETASESEIKKAYRKLSLQYHPDKNPDPEAATYFAEYVTKAYKALTDEAAKANYIKHGHPDGPQAVSISVALPEWFFNKDKEAAPAILLSLLLGGIVLPLGLAACYLKRSHRTVGENEVMPETQQFYLFSPYAIKQLQGVGKMPETMCCAMEFVNLNLTKEEGPALVNELRMELIPFFPEVKDVHNGSFYKKRPPGVVKAQLLLYGHLCRLEIPRPLKKDFEFVLKKSPRLIQEVFMLSTIPRMKPAYGWFAPAIASIELMQCVIRAVSVDDKKKCPSPFKSNEGAAVFLQLPHMDHNIVKVLGQRKIRQFAQLLSMDALEVKSELSNTNLTEGQIADIQTALDSFPCITMDAEFVLEDEDEVTEYLSGTDIVTCKIKAVVSRKAHLQDDFDAASLSGNSIRAYAPNYPYPRDENWIFMVVNLRENSILGHTRVSLVEAERVIALRAKSIESQDDVEELNQEYGQEVDIKFIAPLPGKHDLTVIAMCDCWIGADAANMIPLRAVEPTRAQREGRSARPVKKKIERSEESEEIIANDADESDGEIGPDEEDSEYEDEDLWDSDEYGTEETGSDTESENEGEDEDDKEKKKEK